MAATPIDAAALTIEQFVQVLRKAGSKQASEALIRQHLAAGAPANADGTLHLLRFTAWLAKQINK